MRRRLCCTLYHQPQDKTTLSALPRENSAPNIRPDAEASSAKSARRSPGAGGEVLSAAPKPSLWHRNPASGTEALAQAAKFSQQRQIRAAKSWRRQRSPLSSAEVLSAAPKSCLWHEVLSPAPKPVQPTRSPPRSRLFKGDEGRIVFRIFFVAVRARARLRFEQLAKI